MWSKDAAEKEQIIKVVVELPVEAGDDYQEKSANITFTVEAIQANGVVAPKDAQELQTLLTNGASGTEISLDSTVDYGLVNLSGELKNVVLSGNGAKVQLNVGATAVLENVTFSNLNGVGAGNAISFAKEAVVKNLVIENSVFCNTTNSPYGAIGLTNSTAEITFDECHFYGTKYAVYGQTPAAKLTFNECLFENATSWVVLLNGSDVTLNGAQLTITNCKFVNCTGGIAKYLGSSQPAGAFTIFTNNTLENCKGHDGLDSKWFTIPGATSSITVSGNTLDGNEWNPGTAQGLGK